MSFLMVRPRCFENMSKNLLPQNGWKKILPYYSEAGLDVDYEWQIPQLKFWIKNLKRKNKHGL